MATTGTIGRVSTSRPTLSKLPMSREEFSALGDTKHHEYYDGMCIVNPPQRRHVRAEIRLLDLLRAVCPPAFEVLMEWGWQTGTSIFEPDLMVVPADDRRPAAGRGRSARPRRLTRHRPSVRQASAGVWSRP